MRVLVISTATTGGAGVAAIRSFEALRNANVDVTFISSSLVIGSNIGHRNQIFRLNTVFTRKIITYLQQKFVQSGNELVTSVSLNTIRGLYKNYVKSFDIVHIHAFYNLISFNEIMRISKTKTKVFVTLHDERFFTGGCHYSGSCRNFESKCRNCPQVQKLFRSLPALSLARSRFNLREVEGIHFVSPSTWLARKAMQSSLLAGKNISVVHNPVPDVFFDAISIPRASNGKFTILGFIAEDLGNPNKGFKLFLDALSLLDDKTKSHFRIRIACKRGHELIPSFLDSETSSPVGDEELIRFYRSIDFLVVPSVQDNSPNVIIEALSAGAKVVGSDTGGISELLRPFASVLFRKDSPEDLAKVLKIISQEGMRNSQISDAASYFGYQVHSEKMISLYQNG